MSTDSSDALLHAQRAYYDERAPDYMDLSKPSDRKGRGFMPDELCAELIDEFAPIGDVLELACGSGVHTRNCPSRGIGYRRRRIAADDRTQPSGRR